MRETTIINHCVTGEPESFIGMKEVQGFLDKFFIVLSSQSK